ncbi:PREDICTED: ubiquitin carboxyl-terminal hydrolase 2-like, partial [Galeopterus variegatus]|uniref:ubiquitinyl hydrolase 1 n=1 Tax=Galeopterus variegatus TaxID=482537 RepID=A0ABM0Q2H9_GALVR
EKHFLRLPKILILQVRELTFENRKFHKIQKPVNVTHVLKLHTSPQEPNQSTSNGSCGSNVTPSPEHKCYHLYAMCCHSGDCSGGHYTALVQPSGHEHWYSFNDEQVACVGSFRRDLMHRFGTPYLLLYRRQDPEDRRESERAEPGGGDSGTMTDVAAPKKKVPFAGVQRKTLSMDSATVPKKRCRRSPRPQQDDKPVSCRQSRACT